MGHVANPNDSFTRFIRCYFYLSTNKQIFAGVGMSDQGGTYHVILTLRRLMSYIYMEHPFLMFLDHTQRRSTVGRTPLDE